MYRFIFSFVLFSCVSYSYGAKAAGFKVHFGLINIELPTTVDAATAEGWVLTERPSDALLSDLVMYCPSNDVTVCVLYLDVGYVAGLQIAVPIDYFTNNVPSDLTNDGFNIWTPTQGYYSGQKHWYINQFFISEETLTSSTYEERTALAATGETLYDGGVWVTGGNDDDTLAFIDGTGDITDTLYTKQACIPLMGTHYYYNMSSTTACDNLYPWFMLVDGDQLVGTGFMIFGDRVTPKSGQKDWFEQPSRLAVETIVPSGPQCLYDLSSNPGVTTLHIYYIDSPWSLGCWLG